MRNFRPCSHLPFIPALHGLSLDYCPTFRVIFDLLNFPTTKIKLIIRIYGTRWNIETFFKSSKSLLKLGREFQTRSYDSAVAHTAIVFARYTFLEWLRRQENDPKTYGGLFFALCEDVQDMELSEALRSLMSLFMETINVYGTEDTETIKSKVTNWIASQSRYIKGLFQNLCWES